MMELLFVMHKWVVLVWSTVELAASSMSIKEAMGNSIKTILSSGWVTLAPSLLFGRRSIESLALIFEQLLSVAIVSADQKKTVSAL